MITLLLHICRSIHSYPAGALQEAVFCVDCLRRPFASAIHQNGLFGGRTALLPSPSTKTAFLVDGAWKVLL